MPYILQTDRLTKIIGEKELVRDVDLHVRKGEIYGFLGPNGAGKTTVMKLVTNLWKPTGGRVLLFGEPLTPTSYGVLKRMGSIIEFPTFYPHMTGRENLQIHCDYMGYSRPKGVEEALEQLELDDAADRPVGSYSLGMKQRLGIARALLCRPELLILDEPTNGLDPAGIQEMRELICSLPERFGMTVVVSSHLLSEIDQMADHVAIIREGELVFQDTLEVLHSHSRHHLALRTANNAVARGLLLQKSVPCQEEDGYLILPLLSDGAAAQLTRFLAENRLGVVRLEERQKSLEDIFLELTGKAASL